VTTAIFILNASPLSLRKLDHIAFTARRVFESPVNIEQASLDISRAFDGSRGQYNSSALLAHILSNSPAGNERRIAVVDVDLYVPVLTFVFGEAQFKGPAAIVSTHRLANQFYGMPENDDVLLERLEKEIVHELGHTFGLYHCRQFDCVMHSSTYVEEIDLKKVTPCPACNSVLRQTN